MKKFFLFASLFGALAVNAQDKKPEDVMKAKTEKHDFGTIKQGVPVTTEFQITNVSGQPMILESVTAGCGCTTPEWSKEPVVAGGTTKIKVGFNAAAMNHFEKEVFVKIAGVSQPKVLKITGDVVDAAAYDIYVKGKKNGDIQKSGVTSKAKVKTTTTKKKVKYEKTS